PALDRRGDPDPPRRARGEPAHRLRPARGELSPRVPAQLGEQDVLSAAPHRWPPPGIRGGAPPAPARGYPGAAAPPTPSPPGIRGGAPRALARRSRGAAAPPAPAHRANGRQPALPRGERALTRGDRGAGGPTPRVSAPRGTPRPPTDR